MIHWTASFFWQCFLAEQLENGRALFCNEVAHHGKRFFLRCQLLDSASELCTGEFLSRISVDIYLIDIRTAELQLQNFRLFPAVLDKGGQNFRIVSVDKVIGVSVSVAF